MRKGRGLSAVVVVATIFGLLFAANANAQAGPPTVLVVHGAPNDTVNAGVAAIEALGAANDFEVDTSQSAADFFRQQLVFGPTARREQRGGGAGQSGRGPLRCAGPVRVRARALQA